MNSEFSLRRYSNGQLKPLFRGLIPLSFLFLLPLLSIIMIYYCYSIEQMFSSLKYLFSIFLFIFFHATYHIPNWTEETEKNLNILLHCSKLILISQSWNSISFIFLKNTHFQFFSDFIACFYLFLMLLFNPPYHIFSDSFINIFYIITSSIIIFYFNDFMPYLNETEFKCILINYLLMIINFYNVKHKIFDFIPQIIGYYEFSDLLILGSIWCMYICNLNLMIRS